MAIVSVDSKSFGNERRFEIVKVFDNGQAAATGTTIDVRDAKGICLLVEAGAGVSAGVVTLEAAASSAYAGTWAALDTATTNAASTAFVAGYDNLAAPVPYVRARISTELTGGTCDVYVMVMK